METPNKTHNLNQNKLLNGESLNIIIFTAECIFELITKVTLITPIT